MNNSKPAASSSATHAHTVQFGPSSGLYSPPATRKRGVGPDGRRIQGNPVNEVFKARARR